MTSLPDNRSFAPIAATLRRVSARWWLTRLAQRLLAWLAGAALPPVPLSP